MKKEDVPRAVELNDQINNLEYEIQCLRRRKAIDSVLTIRDPELGRDINICGDAVSKVLDVVIKSKSDELKEAQKNLKAL